MNKKQFCTNCGSREFVKEGKSEVLADITYLICAECGNVMMRDDRTGRFMPTPEEDDLITRLLIADSAKALNVPVSFAAMDENELVRAVENYRDSLTEEYEDPCLHNGLCDCIVCENSEEESDDEDYEDEDYEEEENEEDEEEIPEEIVKAAKGLESVLKSIFGEDNVKVSCVNHEEKPEEKITEEDLEGFKEFVNGIMKGLVQKKIASEIPKELKSVFRDTIEKEEVKENEEKRYDFMLSVIGQENPIIISNKTEDEMAEYLAKEIGKGNIALGRYKVYRMEQIGGKF